MEEFQKNKKEKVVEIIHWFLKQKVKGQLEMVKSKLFLIWNEFWRKIESRLLFNEQGKYYEF